MSQPQIVTKTEYAKLHGWHPSHVSRLVRQGRVVVTDDGKIDVEQSDALVDATTDPAVNRVSSTQSYAEAKARREHYMAELARLDVEKANGKLVEAEQVKRQVYDLFRIVRDQLEQLPARLAPQLSPDAAAQHEMHEMLDAEVRAVLEELCERIGEA